VNPRRREILAALAPVAELALSRGQGRKLSPSAGIRAAATSIDTTEVSIYGAIGQGGWFDDSAVSAADFAQIMNGIDTPNIVLRMNSGGGDVFDGVAIHTLLARHPATVVGYVDGIAASAASFIMMACDKIMIARNAMMMVHDGMTFTYGNPDTHQRAADLLTKVSDNIADMYAVRAGGTEQDWRAAMSANGEDGTWYTGTEAVDAGLADAIVPKNDDPATSARARRALARYTGAPVYVAPEPEPVAAVIVAPVLVPAPIELPDYRDEVADTMLAFLAERMKANSEGGRA
jgi:ATP-dependent protease ClpP protease subunit